MKTPHVAKSTTRQFWRCFAWRQSRMVKFILALFRGAGCGFCFVCNHASYLADVHCKSRVLLNAGNPDCLPYKQHYYTLRPITCPTIRHCRIPECLLGRFIQSPKTFSRKWGESFMAGDDTLFLKIGVGSSVAREVFKIWCRNVTTDVCRITCRVYDGLHI